MAKLHLDTKGMKCPLPILKIATIMPKVKSGDVLSITGDCETFEQDIRKWCNKMGKVLTLLVAKDGLYTAEIQF
jgi:tRNA 2-thiouridine synthesizing protein A